MTEITETTNGWKLFYGDGRTPRKVTATDFPPPPPWRQFRQWEQMKAEQKQEMEKRWAKVQELAAFPENDRGRRKGATFRLSQTEEKAQRVIEGVNAAIYLRRPLLVTGNPGAGKTSLAHAIAHQLSLGTVLTWPITTRSTLKEGLYDYDAIGRLQEVELGKEGRTSSPGEPQPSRSEQSQDIGQYITLGPLGTAFLPSQLPRVLLIDEIDKSDINLPNDLLNLFEEGLFRIPQLVRLARQSSEPVSVQTADKGIEAKIYEGQVNCCAFPIVVMTSNGERDFPAAFLRRCLRVRMPDPEQEYLMTIIDSHFDQEKDLNDYKEKINELITQFGQNKNRATDQLLNMIHLITQENMPADGTDTLRELIFKSLTSQD